MKTSIQGRSQQIKSGWVGSSVSSKYMVFSTKRSTFSFSEAQYTVPSNVSMTQFLYLYRSGVRVEGVPEDYKDMMNMKFAVKFQL